ncbi:MAG: phosphoadenosine phosphosulfate reductase [Ascidiaceihabitans sp.]|nr:phosphoadenosine phosphosulfate reductase [Ascidiaceihabitans sp.]
MQDADNTFDTPLANLPKGEWLKKLAQISEEHGFFQPLGKRHFATFVEDEPTLLVTFETIQGIRSLSETAQPSGWEMVKGVGWSHLCIVSDGDTWFRDSRVYGYFDRLIDDGFFDAYENVIFYGAGPCAYAAAAFSVAAPGATVVAIQPQATLDPRVTEWDDRFTKMRRTDFNNRYGYAPDMLDAADHAYVLYDPAATLDAMHAALFTRPNVTKFRLRNMGTSIQTELLEMQVLLRILDKASAGKLTTTGFAKIFRARRDNRNYLRNVLAQVDARGRTKLATMLCEAVIKRGKAPYFARRLLQLKSDSGEDDVQQSNQ